jgi:hypothetical protein
MGRIIDVLSSAMRRLLRPRGRQRRWLGIPTAHGCPAPASQMDCSWVRFWSGGWGDPAAAR